MELGADDGIALTLKAREKEQDARFFQQWVVQLPFMAMGGKYTGFKEYKDNLTGAGVDMRPTADIMKELDELEASFGKEGA